ncbi:tudor domain-containing protein 3-like isoform X3 [Dendronephthya gigantea]|uniref:tudor domain-containing protein 3-like isoform X3 n=1 Tax=Dendronephthya gigantea TaxID=151771 RepID=UPI00106BBCE7|nr:tudor domain-containing protein 3-like isoform X3 [Dendronephthya gigantea]
MAAEKTSKINDIQSKLRKKGWSIKSDAIEEFVQEFGERQCTDEDVIKWAVNCDLKVVGSKVLSEHVKRGQLQSIEGPVVMQIQKIRNISAPKANEESGAAPRLLKLQLTDGHITCFALENSFIQKLSLSIPPGTKIRLKGTVFLISGFMLLEPRNVDVLGGKVEKLVVKWETNKNVSQQRGKPSMLSDDGPPLFIGFDTRTSGALKKTSIAKLIDDSQKTQSSLLKEESTSQKEENKKIHEDFEHSRDQRIQTAKQGNESHTNPTKTENRAHKSFQSGGNQRMQLGSSGDRGQWRVESKLNAKPSNVQKPDESGQNQRDEAFSNKGGGQQQKYTEKSNRERRPNSQRGGRHNDDYGDEQATSRPSEGTLWDFLETKLPSKGSKGEKVKTKETADDHLDEDGSQYNRQASVQRDGHYRNQRGDQREHGRIKGSAGDQSETSKKQAVSKDYQQSKYENQGRRYERDGRERNEKGNERNRKQSERSRNQQKSEHQWTEKDGRAAERYDNNMKYSKEKQRGSDQRDYQRNNPPSGANSANKHGKQTEKSHENQSGHGGKDFSQDDKQRNDNYRKEHSKYDKADNRQSQGRGGTRQDSHAGSGTQDFRRQSHGRDNRGGVLREQNYRGGIKGTQERDSQMHETSVPAGQSDNQKSKHQNERYREGISGGRSYESRKQHWWNEGEDCLAFHVEHRQYYLAKIIKVEVRHKSCVVMFHDTGKRETINWSNLLPLDFEVTRQPFQSQARGIIHASPTLMQERSNKVQQDVTTFAAPPFTPPNFDEGWPELHGDAVQNNAIRSQRPTQAFYKPPRKAKE